MKEFAPYVLHLANLVEHSSDRRRNFSLDAIASALDGEPSRMLRHLVDVNTRRKNGAFFSGSELGELLTKKWAKQISSQSVILDPACGGGDLLLASARLLPVKIGLRDTIEAWGANLRGIDIHKEFIESSKYRLTLQAIALGAKRQRVSRIEIMDDFPGIRLGNGLQELEEIANATHIVANPPFSPTQAPDECTWTRGLVNSAALFMDTITRNATSGTRIWVILPDVLRSGSRYQKWRQMIVSRLREIQVTKIGQFSRHADVDVFVLEGIIRRNINRKVHTNNPLLVEIPKDSPRNIGDLFTVRVGPVVPHRHRNEGEKVPYLTPHNCPAWKRVTRINEYRGFAGTLFRPPFVVLRRTSRSDDTYRAIGTIVLDKRPVAVENHLLILIPNSGSIADCKRLVRVLKSDSTNAWLNERICCRHLTVSAVDSIPWKLEIK